MYQIGTNINYLPGCNWSCDGSSQTGFNQVATYDSRLGPDPSPGLLQVTGGRWRVTSTVTCGGTVNSANPPWPAPVVRPPPSRSVVRCQAEPTNNKEKPSHDASP